MIRHIVSWKLAAQDEDGKTAAVSAMAESFGALPHLIPGIKTLHFGRDLDHTDGNWDAVLIVDYATEADLAAYQAHPEHVKTSAIVRPLITERMCVDFEL